jgi:hypothetical protein
MNMPEVIDLGNNVILKRFRVGRLSTSYIPPKGGIVTEFATDAGQELLNKWADYRALASVSGVIGQSSDASDSKILGLIVLDLMRERNQQSGAA